MDPRAPDLNASQCLPSAGTDSPVETRLRVLSSSSSPGSSILSPGSPDEFTDPVDYTDEPPVFDALLWSRDAMGNTRFLESGIANLIFEDLSVPKDKPDRFITPCFRPRDGPLPGMVRTELLACGCMLEGDLSVHDVVDHHENWRVYLCNGVRGVFEVQLVP